ncbi:glycoside hydrolase family 5 protein [Methylocystis parvus]|uniref:glycoside hydrolase family 5 protein n=1 Tax=Methylocystis parvus TaxID=134 RepID=UPI003C781BED
MPVFADASSVRLKNGRLTKGTRLSGMNRTYGAPTLSTISAGSPAAASAKIVWRTNTSSDSKVVYGTTTAYGLTATSSSMVGAHSTTLIRLSPATTYHYVVVSTDTLGRTSTSTDRTFTTSSVRIGVGIASALYQQQNFTMPGHNDIDYLSSRGFSTIRLYLCWQKIQPSLNTTLDATYVSEIQSLMSYAASQNIDVILDIHNNGRYSTDSANCSGNATGDPIDSAQVPISSFADLWTRMATTFSGSPGLHGYGLMNEPHDMPSSSSWPNAAQAAINAIRAIDATTTIYVAGDAWDTAVNWATVNPSFPLSDPSNSLVYEAHVYFDNAGGYYPTSFEQQGASQNIGIQRVSSFVTWLQQHNAKGYIGEFGIPSASSPQWDPAWLGVTQRFMTYLKSNNVDMSVHSFDTYQTGDYIGTNGMWSWANPYYYLLNIAPVSNVNDAFPLNESGTTPLLDLLTTYTLGH